MNASELRRLNGFQSRCLRRILAIKPAYYSRVSSKKVLDQSSQPLYSQQLLKQQLVMFGRVARLPNEDPLRRLTFCPNSLDPACSRHIRRVVRPRNEWASKLTEVATQLVNNTKELWTMIGDEAIFVTYLNKQYSPCLTRLGTFGDFLPYIHIYIYTYTYKFPFASASGGKRFFFVKKCVRSEMSGMRNLNFVYF